MIANSKDIPVTYAIYARYSCTLQNERSCDDQIEAIQIDVKRRFPQWKSFPRHFKDEAERGGSVVNRHGFQEMLRLALEPNPPFNAIVIEDLSRFARNKHESTKYRHMLALNGVSVLSMADGYIDESTEAGLWLTGIKELKAEADSREMARRVKRGQRAKAKLGFSTGRPTNYGYRRQIVTDPTNLDIDGIPRRIGTRLEPNPMEAAVVQRIFHLFTEKGLSVKATTATINSEGLRNRRGKPFCSSFVRWVLHQSLYIGQMIYGKRREIRIDTGQRLMKPMPEEEWTNRKAYYGCGGRSQQGYDFCCNQTKLFQEDLEHRVFEVMDEKVLEADIVEQRAKEWQKHIQTVIRKRLSGQPHHREEIAELDKQIANLINAIAQGIDLAEVRQKLEDLKSRRESLQATDANSEALRHRLETGIDLELVKKAVKNSRLALQGKDNLAQVRSELAKYIEGIYVHPNGQVILKAFKHSPMENAVLGDLAGAMISPEPAAGVGSCEGTGEADSPEGSSLANYGYRGDRI